MLSLVLPLVLCGAPSSVVDGAPGKGWRTGGEVIDSAEVLAVSIKGGWAAFKIVSHATSMGSGAPEDQDAIDCGYPGMKQYPTAGVRLMTWSLKKQAVDKIFVVYASSTDQAHCSTADESKQALAAAKAEIASHGLDLAKKPASSLGTIQSSNEEQTADNEGMGDRVSVTTTFQSQGRAFFRFSYSYVTTMAGHAELFPLGAYVEDGKLVFFLRYEDRSMRSLEETFSFSPVLTLPK